jgi:hypothetical protein
MEALQGLPPIVALVLGLVLLAWLVLVFLVPFMIEGIRQSTRKTYEELIEMNEKLDRLNTVLMRNAAAAHAAAPSRAEARPAAPGQEARGRVEPTISDTDFKDPRRDRREPIVR